MGRWLLPFVWQAVVTVILIWNRKVLLRRTVKTGNAVIHFQQLTTLGTAA